MTRQRAIHLLHAAHRAGILCGHRDAGLAKRARGVGDSPLPAGAGRRSPPLRVCASVWLVFGVRLALAETRPRRGAPRSGFRIGFRRSQPLCRIRALALAGRAARTCGTRGDWRSWPEAAAIATCGRRPFNRPAWPPNAPPRPPKPLLTLITTWPHSTRARTISARTEQSLRAAIFDAPNWFKTHWMLAQVLRSRGPAARGASRGRHRRGAGRRQTCGSYRYPRIAFAPRARPRLWNRLTSKILSGSLGSHKWID